MVKQASRQNTHTCSHTSSGTSSLSTKPLTNPKSVSLAAGYAISISLNPIWTRSLKNRRFCSIVIGLTRAWFPSRKSVESQMGGPSIVFEGHVLSGRLIGVYFLYFLEGSCLQNQTSVSLMGQTQKKKIHSIVVNTREI